MEDLELQMHAIDATLHNQNPYSGWYDTGMGKYYGVTKADFWEGDLYEATMAFFCCFEDPEEYPDGCNNHGYTSASGCLSVSFDCGNGHGRLPYAQMYLDNMEGGDMGGNSSRDEEESESEEDIISEEPSGRNGNSVIFAGKLCISRMGRYDFGKVRMWAYLSGNGNVVSYG